MFNSVTFCYVMFTVYSFLSYTHTNTNTHKHKHIHTHTHTHTHTGRSKEIINRGGETISPFEIEEAVQQYPTVKEVLAFSAPHAQVRHARNVISRFLVGQVRDIMLLGCVW